MSTQVCDSGFAVECRTFLCLNNWASNGFSQSGHKDEVNILCKSPGFGGGYTACGLCSKIYNYSSCCTDADPAQCLAKFVANEKDCNAGQGLLSSISNALLPTSTGSGIVPVVTMSSGDAGSMSTGKSAASTMPTTTQASSTVSVAIQPSSSTDQATQSAATSSAGSAMTTAAKPGAASGAGLGSTAVWVAGVMFTIVGVQIWQS